MVNFMWHETSWIQVTEQRSNIKMIINIDNIVAIAEPRRIILTTGNSINVEESYDKLIQMIANYGE